MTHGLGQLIVQRRRELGVSRAELAKRLGIPTANLSTLERTTSRWQSRLLVELARELRLPQVEVLVAAGVITDLPMIGDHDETDDLGALFLGVASMQDRPSLQDTAEVIGAIDGLSTAQFRFLQALLDQFSARSASQVVPMEPLTAR